MPENTIAGNLFSVKVTEEGKQLKKQEAGTPGKPEQSYNYII